MSSNDVLKKKLQNKFNTTFQDTFAEEVWLSTYKDHKDENINDTLYRVAHSAASVEETEELQNKWTEKFYDMLSNFKSTSGGRIYANAGTDFKGTTLMNCLSGDTKIITKKGIFRASELENQTIEVLTNEGKYSSVLWKSYGEQDLIKLTFSNGEIIFTTKNHEWQTTKPNGGIEKITSGELLNRRIPLNGVTDYIYESNKDYEDGIKNGLIFGDGYVYTDFTKGCKYSALQQFGNSRHLVIDHFGYCKVTNYHGDPEGIHYVSGLDESLKYIPEIDKSIDYLRGFIAGVIASDGNVDSRGSVCLHTAKYEYALKIKNIAVRVGLPVVSLRLERENSPFDGKKSELWKLTFVKKYIQNDARLLLKNFHKELMKNSPEANTRCTIKCVGVENTNRKELVYCCNEPTTHTFSLGEFGLLTGNCFVAARRKFDIDSLDNIILNLRNQTFTLKAEGGWGENFSYLRPRGSFVHGVGIETPGAVKYMEMFDKSSDIITAGSGKKSINKKAKQKIRKGAMMGVLDVTHPDIIEFITAKQQPGRLTKFNVSVNCTDHFMHKVIEVARLKEEKASQDLIDLADKWELRFPDTSHSLYRKEWDGNLLHWEQKGYPVIIHNTVSATWLWNLIMDSTYNRAEPGVLFLDRANYFNPLSYAETIQSTNPCVDGECLVLTNTGYEKIKDIVGTSVNVWNGFEYSSTIPKITGHDKKMKLVKFSNGMEIRCTENHKFVMSDGSRKETIQLNVGDKLGKFTYPIIEGSANLDDAYIKGFFSGDGWTNSSGYQYVGLYGEKKKLKSLFEDECPSCTIHEYKISGGYAGTNTNETKLYVNLGKTLDLNKTFVPDTSWTVITRLDWLAGLLDSDGYKTRDSCLQVSSKDRSFLSNVQLMLTTIGTSSTLSEMKDCWRLSISASDAFRLQEIGLECHRLGVISQPQRNASRFIKIDNIIEDGIEDIVYCFTENKNHTGIFNGMMTSQCGEQMLSPGGVCNLGSINLTQFVNDERTGFDLKSIKKYVRYMVRFLDNINTLSSAPLPEYEYSMKNKRRIGVGILGWGSALFMIKTRFGSKEATELREELMKTIARSAYEASIDLAEEKGMFALCEPDKHAQNPFVEGLGLSEEYMTKLHMVGIRNSSLLSIQPTGNTSILANIVSGGLEPIFMPEYIRTVIVGHMPEDISYVTPKWFEGEWSETSMFKFAKEGDEQILRGVAKDGTVYKIDKNRGLTKEVLCEDYGVRYLKKLGEWNPEADWAVTTVDLNVDDHLNDLKGFARYVDSAISKTINVPNNYPIEKFKNIYLDAYKSDYVKGVTTYRSGTMTNVLSAKEEKTADSSDEEIIKEDVKLPDSAPAVMKTLRAEGRKYYVTVVYHENNAQRPFALFVKSNHHESSTTTSDAVEMLLKLARKKGIPKKHLDDVMDKTQSDNNANKVARTISLLLRHGVLIKNIVATLDKVEDVYVGSFVFQIKKFLSAYIKDGEKVEDEKCLECSSTKVVYQEGCKVCMSCGSSKCG